MKEIWFKRKKIGWGWAPVSWQGWGILAMYLYLIFSDISFYLTDYFLKSFLLRFFISTVFLIIVCYEKGESPRWQWFDNNKSQIK